MTQIYHVRGRLTHNPALSYCMGHTVSLEAFNQRIDLSLADRIFLGKQHNDIGDLLTIGTHTV